MALLAPRCISSRATARKRVVSTDAQAVAAPLSQDTRHKVALFVEPSPFSHISGMKNRFESLIKGLREAGDEVVVFTPDRTPPKEFCGAKVVDVLGFRLPFYSSPTLLLSLGLSIRVLWHLITQRPNVIHVSTPGVMFLACTLYSRLLNIPLVMSYHTHIPEYIPKYTWAGLVHPMWSIIRWCTRMADLTLVTSKAMKDELEKNKCRQKRIDIWQRGVDTEVFHPRHASAEMRERMTDGHPEAPLLVYVGRLGAEKNLQVIKQVLEANPGARLALVGDGPQRQELEQHFAGLPVKFMGMMRGTELSAAYATADIFVMPSETETLGFVVLEAMASGLPVVSVAAGGLTDIITRPGETGLLYQPGDIATAAEQVKSLISDKELAARVGQAARQEVEAFGWKAATRKIREQQYSRAIRLGQTRQRFIWLARKVGIIALWRRIMVLLTTVLAAAVARVNGGVQAQQA